VADLAEPLLCGANMHLSALRATALLTQIASIGINRLTTIYI